MFLIDSHCHIDKLNYTSLHHDVADVLSKARQNNVFMILAVSTSILDFFKIRDMSKLHKNILYSCGVHPLNIDITYDSDKLYMLSSDKHVVALGETGLDYYRKPDNKLEQRKIFRDHISIAKKLNKPIIVHTRHACQDTINILYEENSSECRGIVHCFTEDKNAARKFLNLDFYISFSGIVTFRSSEYFSDIIRYVPLDHLLVETDAPYLTPVPYRGQENQPAYVYNIANFLAEAKHITLDTLALATTENFSKLFKIDINNVVFKN